MTCLQVVAMGGFTSWERFSKYYQQFRRAASAHSVQLKIDYKFYIH